MTAPRKAAGTTKKAAAKVVDFDAARKRSGQLKRYPWKSYGRVWQVKRPNSIVLGDLEDVETVGGFINYILAHIDQSERADFVAACREDEELDEKVLAEMAESLAKVVYADLPT
jgi:hypothetical protein